MEQDRLCQSDIRQAALASESRYCTCRCYLGAIAARQL